MTKYFIIYYIDFTNFKVKFENSYSSQEEANENLLSTSLNFVKEEQGKQQADIALLNDKTEKDLLTENFKEGMYIKCDLSSGNSTSPSEKCDNGKTIFVYNKIKEIITGTFFNSWEMKVNKIGMFGVTEIELNIPSPLPPVLPSGIIRPPIAPQVNIAQYKVSCYIDELKNKLKSGNFGLRHIEPVSEVVYDDDVEDGKDDGYDYENYDN